MGMFDRVQVDVQMPGYPTPIPRPIFQTKNFNCQLEEYLIDAKGHLYKVFIDGEGNTEKTYLTNYSGEVRLLSEIEAPVITDDSRSVYEYYVTIHNGMLVSARRERIQYPKIIKESK